MKILKFIENIFKKNNTNNTNSQSIINIQDLIQIPTRDNFINDKNIINEIDYYKNKYYSILFQKRKITTNELKLDNIEKEIVMITELLLKNSKEIDNISLTIEELKINAIKLKLYYNDIISITQKIIYRLISLKELTKNKIPRINKRILEEEINNLYITFITLNNQIKSINLDIESIIKTINIKEENNKLLNNDEYQPNDYIIRKNQEKTIKLYSMVSNKEYNNIEKEEVKIAFIEKYLEIYAYKLKEELENLNLIYNKIDIKTKNKEELLKIMNYLEIKYLILNKYGNKELVSDKSIIDFYKLKLSILTNDIFDIKYPNMPKYNEFEKEYYGKIIEEKYLKIMKLQNNNFNNIFKDNSMASACKMSEFFSEWTGLDTTIVLTDQEYLSILLSFDYEDGFNKYILQKNIYEYPKNGYYKSILNEEEIKWSKKVPLETILKLTSEYCIYTYKSLAYYMYRYINTSKKSMIYKIPEGIEEIFGNGETSSITEKIINNSEGKIVILPQSLRKLSLKFKKIKSIKLNYGLEYIGNESLKKLQANKIIIPSTVKEIEPNALNPKLKTIIFDDFKNSILLHNEEKLIKFLLPLLKITHNEVSMTSVIPKFKEIIFIDENKNNYTITKEELDISTFDVLYFENKDINKDLLLQVISKIHKKLIIKSGYNLKIQYKNKVKKRYPNMKKYMDEQQRGLIKL